MSRAISRALLVTSLALVLGACAKDTTPVPTVAAMWSTQIDQILADKPSDLERRVLTDKQVTDAELTDAMNAFKKCMEDLPYGFEVSLSTGGGFDVGPLDDFYGRYATTEQADAAYADLVASCEDGTSGRIAWLYHAMRDNPEGTSAAAALRECFAEHDVTDGAGLSDDQLLALVTAPGYEPSTPWARSCVMDPTSTELLVPSGEPVEVGSG